MTMIERMDAIEDRVGKLEEKLRRPEVVVRTSAFEQGGIREVLTRPEARAAIARLARPQPTDGVRCSSCGWSQHPGPGVATWSGCPGCGQDTLAPFTTVPVRRQDDDPIVRQLRDLVREVRAGRQAFESFLEELREDEDENENDSSPAPLPEQPPPPAAMAVQPAVPDELHRELEEAVQRVLDTFTPGERLAIVHVCRARLREVDEALDRVLEAREKGSKDGPRGDRDGAISGTDSGAISEMQTDGWPIRGHWPTTDKLNRMVCKDCGEMAVPVSFSLGMAELRAVGWETTCPGPTPTGSATGGS